MALRSSLNSGLANLLARLEAAQFTQTSFTAADVEDRDYRLSVTGFFKEWVPFLVQPALKVVIESLVAPGWRKTIPSKTMAHLAEAMDLGKHSLIRFESSVLKVEDGIDRIPVLLHKDVELSAFRQAGSVRSQRFIELADETGPAQLPLEIWMMICRCSGALCGEYRAVAPGYTGEEYLTGEDRVSES